MTVDILLVFLILSIALVLFFTAWVRMDVVALMVLVVLAITGLISPADAISGFSNPAVITVWAMFILSGALYQTGIARIISKKVLLLSGTNEIRVIFTIMSISGLLSTIMNNIGVAVLMLPVVMDMSHSVKISPSRLLLPLVFSCHLGGLVTLIGTPPNLLASFAMQNAGYNEFKLFSFTPLGISAMAVGIVFMAIIGRYLLPKKNAFRNKEFNKKNLSASYNLKGGTFMMRVAPDSGLIGKTLAESKIRAALGINILSVKRKGGGVINDPGPDTLLRAYDKLFVQGSIDEIEKLKNWIIPIPDISNKISIQHQLDGLSFYEVKIHSNSPLVNKKTGKQYFLNNFKLNLISHKRGNIIKKSCIRFIELKEGDVLLLHGHKKQVEALQKSEIVRDVRSVLSNTLVEDYKIHESLYVIQLKNTIECFDKALFETQLGSACGISVIGLLDDSDNVIMPESGEKIKDGCRILAVIDTEDFNLLKSLVNIEVLDEHTPEPQSLETDDMQMAEVVLAPRSLLAGKTLREMNFRNKYGLTVLAMWSEGRTLKNRLNSMPLQHGEALLLYGKRENFEIIAGDPDFVLLTESLSKPLRTNKAMTSIAIMLMILVPVMFGLMPLAIMAILGVVLMVLTGCLKMEEAYRSIEWRSVFLIAGMLPLGIAMDQTGAADLLANKMIGLLGVFGPMGIVAGLYIIAMASTLAIPPPAIVVIMSPIVINTAESFNIAPSSLMMAVAIAASSSFLSPVSHAANLLVMAPGEYKFIDYFKTGLPLAIVVMITTLILLPFVWPL